MKTIIINNKLIGGFMNWKTPEVKLENGAYSFPNGFVYNDKLEYHKSWRWLMPVVEKIEAIENCRFEFEIRASITEIYDTKENKEIYSNRGDKKIDIVYLTAIEFIKFYNQNK